MANESTWLSRQPIVLVERHVYSAELGEMRVLVVGGSGSSSSTTEGGAGGGGYVACNTLTLSSGTSGVGAGGVGYLKVLP